MSVVDPHWFQCGFGFISRDLMAKKCKIGNKIHIFFSVADPDPGLGAFLTLG
jgi:hypothetical protein